MGVGIFAGPSTSCRDVSWEPAFLSVSIAGREQSSGHVPHWAEMGVGGTREGGLGRAWVERVAKTIGKSRARRGVMALRQIWGFGVVFLTASE